MNTQRVMLSDIRASERVSYFRDVVCTHLYNITPGDLPDSTAFTGRWEVRDCGRFGFADVESNNARRGRSTRDIARDGFDDIAVQRVVTDRVTMSFRDETFNLRAGDICIFALDWQHELHGAGGIGLRTLELPRAAMAPLLAGGTLQRPRFVPGDSPMGQILTGSMNTAWAQLPQIGEAVGEAVLHNMAGLVALASGSSPDGRTLSQPSVQSARLEAAQRFAGQLLSDPALSPAKAAAALGISVRALHLLFEPTGETFAQHVTRRRLEACRSALEAPDGANRSVVDIAFGWGFGSLSSFYRAFTAAYGVAPGDIRQAAQGRASR